jgi:Ca2+-binding EF-hand superfamily protein
VKADDAVRRRYAEFEQCMGKFLSPELVEFKDITQNIFNLFDVQHHGSIDFEQFVLGLHRLVKGGLQDHIDFSFRLFDLDGENGITRQGLIKLLRATMMLREDGSQLFDVLLPRYMEIFNRLDADRNRRISRAEFQQAMKDAPELMQIFEDIRDDIPRGLKLMEQTRMQDRIERDREALVETSGEADDGLRVPETSPLKRTVSDGREFRVAVEDGSAAVESTAAAAVTTATASAAAAEPPAVMSSSVLTVPVIVEPPTDVPAGNP